MNALSEHLTEFRKEIMGKVVTYVRIPNLKSVKSLCNHYGTHTSNKLTYASNNPSLLDMRTYILNDEELETAKELLGDKLIKHITLGHGEIIITRALRE